MAQPSKRKVEFMLHQEELPEFLKQLGEEMASGSVSVGDAKLDVSDFSKLSLTLKNENNGVLVKIKIKYDDAMDFGSEYDFENGLCYNTANSADLKSLLSGSGPEKPRRYNPLKKIMKKQFKAIRCALLSGALPSAALTQQFVQASEWMCSFPGKGDAHYGPYLEAVGAFSEAVAKQDIEGATACAEKLNALKKSCHNSYK